MTSNDRVFQGRPGLQLCLGRFFGVVPVTQKPPRLRRRIFYIFQNNAAGKRTSNVRRDRRPQTLRHFAGPPSSLLVPWWRHSSDHAVYRALVGVAHHTWLRYPLWKNAVSGAAKDLRLKPSKIDNPLFMDVGNFVQYVHFDDEIILGDDRIVRDMPHKLKQKFLVKKDDSLSKVGNCVGMWDDKWREQNLSTSSSHEVEDVLQSPKGINLECCTTVSTH